MLKEILSIGDRVTKWIDNWKRRKDDKTEKDVGKAVLNGDEPTINDNLNRMYKDKR